MKMKGGTPGHLAFHVHETWLQTLDAFGSNQTTWNPVCGMSIRQTMAWGLSELPVVDSELVTQRTESRHDQARSGPSRCV
jgi:hypothetical protein